MLSLIHISFKILYTDFERFQVNLTDRLLIRVGEEHSTTVCFLIVHYEMLDIRINTLCGKSVDGIQCDHTAKNTVLRIVLKVTSGKCTSRCV